MKVEITILKPNGLAERSTPIEVATWDEALTKAVDVCVEFSGSYGPCIIWGIERRDFGEVRENTKDNAAKRFINQ